MCECVVAYKDCSGRLHGSQEEAEKATLRIKKSIWEDQVRVSFSSIISSNYGMHYTPYLDMHPDNFVSWLTRDWGKLINVVEELNKKRDF